MQPRKVLHFFFLVEVETGVLVAGVAAGLVVAVAGGLATGVGPAAGLAAAVGVGAAFCFAVAGNGGRSNTTVVTWPGAAVKVSDFEPKPNLDALHSCCPAVTSISWLKPVKGLPSHTIHSQDCG